MITGIAVGMNSCGIAAGAQEVYDTVKEQIDAKKLSLTLRKVGCVGMCYREPLLDIITEDGITTYGEMNAKKTLQVITEHVVGGKPIESMIVKTDTIKDGKITTKDVDNYFSKQNKIVLENSGYIDPESIEEYISREGYNGLKKAVGMKPEDIIDTVLKSGLRGRGGAGFPTGMKWKFIRGANGDTKYIICNADEGDPGAFMDRNVLEGDPHRVLEGMVVCALATGATHGYIYCRAEYPLAIHRLEIAIKQATEKGFLGKNILGKGFDFEIQIKKGAGAFVCGEETALMASIEGRRGMPRPRPPFPAVKGLNGKPSNINNVETFANIPWIMRNGWEAYASIGYEKSRGTKVFALAGKIKRGGNVEVRMGMPLREIINDIGGGSNTGKPIKAVQLGGPSGGCLPISLFETPVSYEALTATGVIVGSGGMVVMDEDTCMVDVARYFLDFTVKESCGKCTYCRIGMKRMYEILNRIVEGNGTEKDVEDLKTLAPVIKQGSLCALGGTAPNPVLTTLRYFGHEYDAHIKDKTCPAKACRPLIKFRITDKCTGCTLCMLKCPAHAIEGERKKVHVIDQEKCTKCGECLKNCRFDAVEVL